MQMRMFAPSAVMHKHTAPPRRQAHSPASPTPSPGGAASILARTSATATFTPALASRAGPDKLFVSVAVLRPLAYEMIRVGVGLPRGLTMGGIN